MKNGESCRRTNSAVTQHEVRLGSDGRRWAMLQIADDTRKVRRRGQILWRGTAAAAAAAAGARLRAPCSEHVRPRFTRGERGPRDENRYRKSAIKCTNVPIRRGPPTVFRSKIPHGNCLYSFRWPHREWVRVTAFFTTSLPPPPHTHTLAVARYEHDDLQMRTSAAARSAHESAASCGSLAAPSPGMRHAGAAA